MNTKKRQKRKFLDLDNFIEENKFHEKTVNRLILSNHSVPRRCLEVPIYRIFEKLNKFEKVLFYVKTGIFRKIDELLNFETPILRIFRAYLGAEWLQISNQLRKRKI